MKVVLSFKAIVVGVILAVSFAFVRTTNSIES